MSAVRVHINPLVLSWALDRTGLDDEALLRRFLQLEKWQSGELQPTLKQAKELAQAAHIPFGRLLLDKPSGEDAGVADFRTVRSAPVEAVSPDLQETLFSNQNRLAWYSDFATDQGIEPPTLFGAVEPSASPEQAAAFARDQLALEETQPVPGSDKVREIALRMEDNGILVARNGVVGDANKRTLDIGEFRGFTIAEDGYPLVFVNTRDAKSAQLFSLAHELGHVVRGEPGISDHSERQELERWCNRFAAEFLAPPKAVRAVYKESGEDLLATVSKVAKRFGLSREAMLWRLVELGLVTQPEADEVAGAVVASPPAKKKNDGGPPRHTLVRSRVGGLFYDTVIRAAMNGQIPEFEAARYLGAKTHGSFMKLVEMRPEQVPQRHAHLHRM